MSDNDSSRDDSSPKKREGKCCACMRGHVTIFYIMLAFMVVAILLCGAALALAGRRLHVALHKLEAAETAAVLGKVSTAITMEPFEIRGGNPCSEACVALDARLEELDKRKNKYGVDMDEIRKLIEEGRKGYAPETFSPAAGLAAYSKANLEILTALRHSLAEQTDTGFAAQMGLSCVAGEIRPFNDHYNLLTSHLLSEWSSSSYNYFLGTEYNAFEFPDCSPYLNLLSKFNYIALVKNGPTLVARPSLSFDNVVPTLDLKELQTSLTWLQVQSVETGNKMVNYWKARADALVLILVMLCIAVLLLLVLLILVPICIDPPYIPSEMAVTREYALMESKSKALSQYSQCILALKQEDHLYHFDNDVFMQKITGFIRRVRPCIVQTCFGDLETATFTGTGEIMSTRGDDAAVAATEDEQRSQELRADLGLQLVCGTFLCIAVGEAYSDSGESKMAKRQLNVDEYVESVTNRMNTMVIEVERVIASKRGVLHTITGDYIYATWNVVSACSTGELNALSASFELVELFKGMGKTPSISIARSAAVAGNIEAAGQRTAVICGPAIARCEQLDVLNSYHGTSIMLDHEVAAKLSSAGIAGFDFCVVPVSLYELFRPPLRQEQETSMEIAYAVYPVRQQERLKAWTNIFKEIPHLFKAGKIEEVVEMIEGYRTTYINNGEQRTGRKGLAQIDNSKTINFWLMSLNKLQNRGKE